jgi:hypothetical protein
MMMILYKVQYCSLAVGYIMKADEATLQEGMHYSLSVQHMMKYNEAALKNILDSMHYLPSNMYVMRHDGAALQDDKYITHCFLLITWCYQT